MEKYMKVALNEANKSFLKGEVPVGAIIVQNDRIIAKAHNLKENKKKSINHAEIIAIQKACKKLNTWHLDDCEIYITLEPCLMCYGAILESRIKKVFYSVKSPKYGYSKYLKDDVDKIKKVIIFEGILENESSNMLKKFFKLKRK